MNKILATVGIVLMVFGIVGLIHPAIPVSTQQDQVRVGPFHTTVETKKSYVVPPILSGLVLACGVAFLLTGWKKKPS